MTRFASRALTPVLPRDRAVMPRAADQLRWTTAEKFIAHRNMHYLFPCDVVPAGTGVHEVATEATVDVTYTYEGEQLTLDGYFRGSQMAALLALKRGRIVL